MLNKNPSNKQNSNNGIRLAFLLLTGCLIAGLAQMYQATDDVTELPPEVTKPEVVKQETPPALQPIEQTKYSCEGKTRCSQMSSCEEARFYQDHCAVMRLDSDKDGVPCEGTLCENL
jgi:hypothetical protein